MARHYYARTDSGGPGTALYPTDGAGGVSATKALSMFGAAKTVRLIRAINEAADSGSDGSIVIRNHDGQAVQGVDDLDIIPSIFFDAAPAAPRVQEIDVDITGGFSFYSGSGEFVMLVFSILEYYDTVQVDPP